MVLVTVNLQHNNLLLVQTMPQPPTKQNLYIEMSIFLQYRIEKIF